MAIAATRIMYDLRLCLTTERDNNEYTSTVYDNIAKCSSALRVHGFVIERADETVHLA